MKKLSFSKHILPHALAIVAFLVVTIFFFNPIFFENKALDQSDIQQYLGTSKTLRDYREATGKEGLWAGSMFSGMPAYLVSLKWSEGPVVAIKKVLSLFLPHPIANIFVAFVCYYILLLAFRVRTYLAIAGALAFGLSSYMIIGLGVGHNARIGAIAFVPLVIAGVHLAFSRKWLLGCVLMAAGLALHLRENHLQITYYLLLVLIAYGLIQFIYALRAKQINKFFKSVGVLVLAAVLAIGTFAGPFWAVTEYSRYSSRGPSELVKPNAKKANDGLSKEYAFAYKYGVWESMALLIPNFYGGTSMNAFVQDQKSETYKALAGSSDNELANQLASYSRAYWGPQGSTVGSYYAGSIIIFLFVVGILFADRKYVWWLVPISAFGLMLSWGDAFASFNYFVHDYLPGYNKFRSVSFALVMILFAMPLLGMLGLEKLLGIGINKEAKKKLWIAFASTGGVCLALILFSSFGSFLNSDEAQLPVWFSKALSADRRGLLVDDAIRSGCFIAAIFIMLYFNIGKKISELGFYGILIFFVTMDLAIVDKRYFTKESYQRKKGNVAFEATLADQEILKDKSYYRVYNLQGAFQEARTSYFHNSLGGYSGAKMRRYQDLYDSIITDDTRNLVNDAQAGQLDFTKYHSFNLLNAKYIVYGVQANQVIPNPNANGAAWFVKSIQEVNSPIEELALISKTDTKNIAIIDKSKFKIPDFGYDSLGEIRFIESAPARLKYESTSNANGLAVFSEIYYPKGWIATIDGKETPILRADYVLRALEIPAGKHTIEFRFEPKPYLVGNKITMASSWILLILVIGGLGFTVKKELE
jgi:hypothetical protein